MKKIKVYTKTGDTGTTSLIGGTRVPKSHPRIEAYGTLDELNVFTGAIRDFDIDNYLKEQLLEIQKMIMNISAVLATDKQTNKTVNLNVTPEDIEWLEKKIDEMDEHLPPLTSLVIPGGNSAVTACHKARVICRRAERSVISLNSLFKVDTTIITFLNRLSDYFFVLGRKIAADYGFMETPWFPKNK
jgi:cob(I)alamin adenosyltransferase